MNDSVKNFLGKVKSTAAVAGEAAGRTLDSAGKKAGELWEITKLNLQSSELSGEINRLMQKMGELVYAAHLDPNTDTDSVDEMLESIDEKKKAINDIARRVAELKQQKLCPRCNMASARSDNYCRSCGARFPAEQRDEADGGTE